MVYHIDTAKIKLCFTNSRSVDAVSRLQWQKFVSSDPRQRRSSTLILDLCKLSFYFKTRPVLRLVEGIF